MFEITNLRQGAVLNHHHGVEDEHGLAIKIEGICDLASHVTVNDVPARRDGRRFFADVTLTEKVNTITAKALTAFGEFTQSIQVVWDKKSFRRCNFYIDDHSFFWTDLIKERPKRAFDQFYLAGLKKIHEKYDWKVVLNCFYRNDHFGGEMKDVPDVWRNEFIDNSDWLRLSFHAYSEFPDRPYVDATYEDFAKDYDLVKSEIARFAGEETFSVPNVIHWAQVSPGAAKALIDRGLKAISTTFRPRTMVTPSLADRAAGNKENNIAGSQLKAAPAATLPFGFDDHFNAIEENSYLGNHRVFFNPYLGVFFFCNWCCANLVPLDQLPERFAKADAAANSCGSEVFSAVSHEQYEFPYYHNYLPDGMARLECAAKLMAESGCTPVFFSEGLLGNKSWDK